MKKILFVIIAIIASGNCFAQTVTINKDYILIGTKKIEKNSNFSIDKSFHLSEVKIGDSKDGEKRFFVVKEDEKQILKTKAAIKESSDIDLELTPGKVYKFEWKESFRFNTVQGKPDVVEKEADNSAIEEEPKKEEKPEKDEAKIETASTDNQLVDKVETPEAVADEGGNTVNGYLFWNLLLTAALLLLVIYVVLNNAKVKNVLRRRKVMIDDLREQLSNSSYKTASPDNGNLKKQVEEIKNEVKRDLKGNLKNELANDLKAGLQNDLESGLKKLSAEIDALKSEVDSKLETLSTLRQTAEPNRSVEEPTAKSESRPSLQSEIAHSRGHQNDALSSIQFGKSNRFKNTESPKPSVVEVHEPAAQSVLEIVEVAEPQEPAEKPVLSPVEVPVSEAPVKIGWNMQDDAVEVKTETEPETIATPQSAQKSSFNQERSIWDMDDDEIHPASQPYAHPTSQPVFTTNTDNGASINWLDFPESNEGYFKLMGEDPKTGKAIFQAYQDFETDDCLFKAKIFDNSKAEFDLISLRRVQYLSYISGAINSVGSCSLKDANNYGLVSKGYAEKTPDGSWMIVRKVEIEVSK